MLRPRYTLPNSFFVILERLTQFLIPRLRWCKDTLMGLINSLINLRYERI